jgi:hypothetical protein
MADHSGEILWSNLTVKLESPAPRVLWVCPSFSIQIHKPPCRFHRWMQRVMLGFRWEKVK